jgi:hypothetical protein
MNLSIKPQKNILKKNDFFVRKSIISRRIRSRITLARESEAEGILFDEKTEGQKSRDTVPLTTEFEMTKNSRIKIEKGVFIIFMGRNGYQKLCNGTGTGNLKLIPKISTFLRDKMHLWLRTVFIKK